MRLSPGLVGSFAVVLSFAPGCLVDHDDLLGPPEPPATCPSRQGEVVNLGDGKVLGTSGAGVVVARMDRLEVIGMTDGSRLRVEVPATTSAVAAVALEAAILFPTRSDAFQVISLADPAQRSEIALPQSRALAQLARGGDDLSYLITQEQENAVTPGGPRALERYRLGQPAPEPLFTFPPGRDDDRITVSGLQVSGGQALWIERAAGGGSARVVLFDLATGQERELTATATGATRIVAAKQVGASVFVSLQGEAPALLQLALDSGALQATYAQPTSGVPFHDLGASGGRLYAISAPLDEHQVSCWHPELFELVPPATAGGNGTSFAVAFGGYGEIYLRDGLALFTISAGCCGPGVCQPFANVGCVRL